MPNPNPPPPPFHSRFKKGEVHNPGGFPKGKRISTWMVELGQLSLEELEKKERRKDLPINALIAIARIRKSLMQEGEYSATILLDRTEGAVMQRHQVEGTIPVGDPADIARRLAKDTAKGSGPGTE